MCLLLAELFSNLFCADTLFASAELAEENDPYVLVHMKANEAANVGLYLGFATALKSQITIPLKCFFRLALNSLQEAARALNSQIKDVIAHEADPDSIKFWQGPVLDLHLTIANEAYRFISGMPDLSKSGDEWVSLRDTMPVSRSGISLNHGNWDALESNILRPLRYGAVLPDFTLEGPLDLYFSQPTQLQLWLPHSVDVGALRRVKLRQGAAVTIHGARSAGLRRPLDLPGVSLEDFVAFAREDREGKKAAGLMHLASGLRDVAYRKWNTTLGESRKNTPAVVELEIAFGDTQGPLGALLAAPSAHGKALQRLKLRKIENEVVELIAQESMTEDSSKALAMSHVTPYIWPLRGAAPSTVETYENLLRDVLARQIFSVEPTLMPQAAGDLPVRLLRSTAQATVLLQFDLEVRREIEEKSDRDSLPLPKELLIRMAGFEGRRSGREIWRAVVQVEGSVAEENLRFLPVLVKQMEVFQDTVTFAPAALHGLALGNRTDVQVLHV